jgi:hypothetical protein
MWCGCALVVPFLFQPTTSLHGIIGGLNERSLDHDHVRLELFARLDHLFSLVRVEHLVFAALDGVSV